MSEVTLSIAGRSYRVACAAGEEERVTRLGAVVAEKLASLGQLSGNEAQNLLFAALLLADEAHEGRDTAARASDDIAAARREAEAATGERDRLQAEIAHLRDAQTSAAGAIDDATSRIAALTQSVSERDSECADLRDQVATLTDRLAERGAPQTANGAAEADLAPALERLAEMLEDCADKLEA